MAKIAESGHEMAQLWQRIAAMRYVGFSVYFRGEGVHIDQEYQHVSV